MAYNFYKNPPRSDFERELREWNDRQPLNPSTYEDGTRIMSGTGQVEIERFGRTTVYDEAGALWLADMCDKSPVESLLTPPKWADDIRARVAEMRRLREEADKKKLAEAAIGSESKSVG